MRPIAQRNGLTMLQLACAWDLAHEPVACVAPTLIQEAGAGARARSRTSAPSSPRCRASRPLSAADVALIRAIGDNTGCMALKGAVPDHAGADLPDRWSLRDEHLAAAARWQIDPQRDLVATLTRSGAAARSAALRLDALDLVAGGGDRGEDRLGVLGAARLERQLDAGLAHLQVDRLADVLDGEQVAAGRGDRRAAAPRARRAGRRRA